MSGGNFARLTDGLLVSKGGAKPSPMMASEISPFALARKGEAEPSPVMPESRRELLALSTVADVAAKPGRMFELSANEYEALDLLADKKGTTPQHLLRKVLRNFLVECLEPCNGSEVLTGSCA